MTRIPEAPSPSSSVPLPGSFRDGLPAGMRPGPLAAGERVEFTVVLRRRQALPGDLVAGASAIGREELAERFGADPADVAEMQGAVEAAGLTVTEVHPGSRRMAVSGPAGGVGAFLGTELVAAHGTDRHGRTARHRARTGSLHVPAKLADVAVAVLGTDDRPHGRPLLRRLSARDDAAPAVPDDAAPAVSYTPLELGEAYGFPADADGSGTVAALVEFGGGYADAGVRAYFRELGVTPPSVRWVGVSGATNSPGKDGDSDGEVQLDIEVLGALAPGADLVVYFAPATTRGYVDAVSAAVHADPTPTVLSISWGAPENHWTPQTTAALEEALADAAALGITVCAAAGDTGSTDGEKDGKPHLDYPGSSPHVLSVGGTTLRFPDRRDDAPVPSGETAGRPVPVETVWNALAAGGGATGGGRSATFPAPLWQHGHHRAEKVGSPAGEHRGVPDVAAVADPSTGYRIHVDGKATTLGGTSAGAPLWAALVCRLSQQLGTRLGLLPPLLYALQESPVPLTDITSGDNGGYAAAAGWDPCTGLGTPRGTALLTHLQALLRPHD